MKLPPETPSLVFLGQTSLSLHWLQGNLTMTTRLQGVSAPAQLIVEHKTVKPHCVVFPPHFL